MKSDAVYIPSQTADLPRGSVVAIEIVEDPHSRDGEKIQVLRSVRDDPLGWMKSRDQIDQAQFKAGRKWQKLHECSTIGVLQAIDPAKEAVDGGKMRDPITNVQMAASDELSAASELLGNFGTSLVSDVLGLGYNILEAARRRGCESQREVDYVGRRFRECLETLAIFWGYAPPKRQS